MAQIEFWFDPASTYSYLSAMRIDDRAAASGVGVSWRPFLLGPIFKAQGWTTSPFNVYPAKGRHMVRDIERIAAERGLAFRLPEPFPAASLLAARVATVGVGEGWTPRFIRKLYLAEFAEGQDIADPTIVAGILASIGADPEAALAAAATDAVKAQLRASTEQAGRIGIFGAPTFVTADGELFWGDDRLDQALRWAAAARPRSK